MKDLLPTGFPPMLFQIFNLNVVRLLRLCWWGVRSFYFGVGGLILLGGHVILKLKLHNTSIKSIFGITNLIYFRDIWKLHLLSSDKISFSMAIWCKCLEHSAVFPVNLFWSNLHLMFPPLPFSWNSHVWSFFSSILGIGTFFFWKVLKFFV